MDRCLVYWRETPRERACSSKLCVPAHIRLVGVRVRGRAAAGAAAGATAKRGGVDAVDVLAAGCSPRCASPRTEMPLAMECCSWSSCWWILESLSSPAAAGCPCARATSPVA